MTEDEKYLHNHFLISIKSGLQSLEDIIDEALEIIDEEGLESVVSANWVEETIKQEHQKHLNESASWQSPTDTELLRSVFDNLCRQKIIALHNAGYNISDAVYDAKIAWQTLEDENIQPIGYCYYHGQDLARVIESGLLTIGFAGKQDGNEKQAILIGNSIVSELKKAGFTVNWGCTATKRIEIINLKWQNLFISDEQVENLFGYDRIIDLMK